MGVLQDLSVVSEHIPTMELSRFCLLAFIIGVCITSCESKPKSEESCQTQERRDCLSSCDGCNSCPLCAICIGSTSGLCDKCKYCKDGADGCKKQCKKGKENSICKTCVANCS